MEIIDARHHLWDLSRFNYGRQRALPQLNGAFAIGNYEENTAELNVVKSIHVQADVDPEFAL